MEKNKKLKKRLVSLESEHFALYSELQDLDKVLKQIGFPKGVSSLKMVAKKFITERHEI